jgi:hypothetical protein
MAFLMLAALIGCVSSKQAGMENPSNIRKFDLERKSFIVFKEAALKTDFKSDKKENDIDSLYHITGNFDLDLNGKADKISITLGRRVNNQDSIIQINDKRLQYVFDNPGDVFVCDLDKRDKFEEIAINDDGPSGDSQIVFFRYDGDDIQKLGAINGEAASLAIDGLGRILPTGGVLSPEIITHMYELAGNEINKIALDYSDAMNKEYTFLHNIDVYFAEMDTIPPDFVPSWDENLKISFKEGDKVIIKSARGNGMYEVELGNGQKGVLYFWVGD